MRCRFVFTRNAVSPLDPSALYAKVALLPGQNCLKTMPRKETTWRGGGQFGIMINDNLMLLLLTIVKSTSSDHFEIDKQNDLIRKGVKKTWPLSRQTGRGRPPWPPTKKVDFFSDTTYKIFSMPWNHFFCIVITLVWVQVLMKHFLFDALP